MIVNLIDNDKSTIIVKVFLIHIHKKIGKNMFILSTKVPKGNTVWASKYVIVQLSSNSLDYSAYHIGLSKVLCLLNVSSLMFL